MSSLLDSNSRFSVNPTNINSITRSKFNLSNDIKTTFNVGQLVPIDCIEVLPGDTMELETNILVRLQTLLAPVMDDLYLDMYSFFVPNRLTWDNWQAFCGENTKSAWYPETVYQIPQIDFSSVPVEANSIFDYLGVPPNYNGSINALPYRAYQLIYNEWFRDQNLQDPLLINKSDTTSSLTSEEQKPYMANKYHDYFTSALPAPQKGPDVSIPVFQDVYQPVYSKAGDKNLVPYAGVINASPLKFGTWDNTINHLWHSSKKGWLLSDSEGTLRVGTTVPSEDGNYTTVGNLWTKMQGMPVATINQLRLAFQTQKLYEKDARGGTRYVEILKSHFGVTSPDSRLQRPELLSYNHIPINITQIVQNSETGTTPQGHTTAMSLTANSDGSFTKSFTEHGYILILACARYNHTYQQGLNKMWSRKSRFDFYWPVFANIGEQPILNKEIYAFGDDVDRVFGYQEAWADYRYKPNRTSAEMRSSHPQSFDVWHFGDNYDSQPFLSSSWISENPVNVDRTLAVTSKLSNQIFCDIYFKNIATRPMPMYSVPGFIDHF